MAFHKNKTEKADDPSLVVVVGHVGCRRLNHSKSQASGLGVHPHLLAQSTGP